MPNRWKDWFFHGSDAALAPGGSPLPTRKTTLADHLDDS